MKKQRILFLLSSLVMIAMLFVACEGPMGPAGADGKDGAAGLNGTDGKDGVDGNVVCLKCHTLANKAAKEMEFAMSTHHNSNLMYNGQTVYEYAGGRKSCGTCHSHEGYVETDFTGADTLLGDIAHPHAIACATCHGFHSTLDFENDGDDWALRNTSPVTWMFDGNTVDFGNTSNTCAKCHQTRRAAPTPASADSFRITSSHWGPHHGPQGNLLEGVGGYEIAGSVAYPADGSHAHRKDAKCATCHIGTYKDKTGGHTFLPNVENCKSCHTAATSFDLKGLQTDVQGLLDQIEAKLETAGAVKDGHVVPGTYAIDVAGAYFNWALCGFEDKSKGVHNPTYVKALLTNTLEAL